MTHERYLKLAYQFATRSPDPSTQIGAVVTNGDLVIGGYNHFPYRCNEAERKEWLSDRDIKLPRIEHGERNALFKYAQYHPLAGTTLYTQGIPCVDCARAAGGMGVRTVVTHKWHDNVTPERWKKSCELGLDILDRYRVQVIQLDIPIDAPKILYNKSLFDPMSGTFTQVHQDRQLP